MSTLPLKPVVDVFYQLQAISAPRKGFNLGALVGNTLINYEAPKDTIYESVEEMLEFGYKSNDPEVLAAQVYFSASSRPGQLYVHTWVDTATAAVKSYTGPIENGDKITISEETYTVGPETSGSETSIEDILTKATEAGATEATYSNNILRITFQSGNTGSTSETVAFSIEGKEVNSYPGLDATTAIDTFIAMRSANSEWYAAAFCKELLQEDVLAISAYVESSSIYTTWFFNTSSEDVVNGIENNLFETLKGYKYNRTFGLATLQPYTHVGAMAYCMGQISDRANSSFTVALKSLTGCLTDNFTSQQVNSVESNYGNVYINRGSYYDMLEKGNVFSGAWYDEIIQLDKLVNDIQLDVMDVLYQNPKIPQTEGGVSRIMSVIGNACRKAITTGFIAPGQWNGVEILNLTAGDYLPDGYLIQAESIDDQSQADRDARKCPNIYVAIKLAGAIQSVVIQVDVNR